MAFVYRPTKTKIVDQRRRRSKSRLYWASYRSPMDGLTHRHALKLPSGVGIADREVAEAELRKLLARLQRQAAGLIDRSVVAASIPVRKLLADYARHLRRRRVSRNHVLQTIQTVRWIMDKGDIARVADLTEERIDAALGRLADGGRSPRTVNVYRSRLHALCDYAVKVLKVLDRNPVSAVTTRETATDIRKVRRALTHDEARKLLAVAGERSLFYEAALLTGLRVGELRDLRWGDLDLDGEPIIRLRAEATKAKRADDLPLNPALADKLAAARPPFARPDDRVFKTTPTRLTFLRDCRRAGVPIVDDRGRTVDRHSLRTTFVTWLSSAGVAPRTAQRLARHAKIDLTMKNYTDPRLLDAAGAVALLPDLRSRPRPEERGHGHV